MLFQTCIRNSPEEPSGTDILIIQKAAGIHKTINALEQFVLSVGNTGNVPGFQELLYCKTGKSNFGEPALHGAVFKGLHRRELFLDPLKLFLRKLLGSVGIKDNARV